MVGYSILYVNFNNAVNFAPSPNWPFGKCWRFIFAKCSISLLIGAHEGRISLCSALNQLLSSRLNNALFICIPISTFYLLFFFLSLSAYTDMLVVFFFFLLLAFTFHINPLKWFLIDLRIFFFFLIESIAVRTLSVQARKEKKSIFKEF